MIHPLSLVAKRGSSFDYESSLVVRVRARLVIEGRVFLRYVVRFWLYGSHYMYTWFYYHFTYIMLI